jgi:hypothetical protein
MYHVFQPPPPFFEPTLNPAEIEEEYVRNPGVDTHADSGPSVQTVSMFETVTKVPVTNAVGSNAESTQPPYLGVIVGKLSQEAKLSRVRALSNVTKLVVKLDG